MARTNFKRKGFKKSNKYKIKAELEGVLGPDIFLENYVLFCSGLQIVSLK